MYFTSCFSMISTLAVYNFDFASRPNVTPKPSSEIDADSGAGASRVSQRPTVSDQGRSGGAQNVYNVVEYSYNCCSMLYGSCSFSNMFECVNML